MIFLRYDIVVDATDNAPSRYMISDCCVVLGKVNFPPFEFWWSCKIYNCVLAIRIDPADQPVLNVFGFNRAQGGQANNWDNCI